MVKAKILAAALAALLLTSAASASPGNGNGNGKENGHGSPAFVGGGSGEAKAKGSPPDAAARGQARKAENAVRKAERRAAREAARGDAPAGPARLNPARACKAERDEVGDEAFTADHGTNENGANAFGKCVSELAKEQGEEGEEPGTGEPADSGSAEEASSLSQVIAFVRSFLQSMRESL